MNKLLSSICVLFSLSACATDPDDISAQSVSSFTYENYTCQQVASELSRVSGRLGELYISLDKRATLDTWQTAGGVIVWPALLFLDGDGSEATEYGRLRGEFETLERVAVQKQCGINFEQYKPKTSVR